MTAPKIRAMKQKGGKVTCVTAYDISSATLCDLAGVDVILVGDSVGNVVLGMETTLPVTMADMIHHTMAARKGIHRALLVADLPFGSYQASVERAVESAIALVKAGAEAVKLEGPYTEQISAIVRAGIPVMGHVGMTPQSVNNFGGFKVQGKGDDAEAVIAAARAVDEAGAFAMVLELVPAGLAAQITDRVSCPTIGIGAGPRCDGQVQVFHDMLGLSEERFRHVKAYAEGRKVFIEALQQYVQEVRDSKFPGNEHSV